MRPTTVTATGVGEGDDARSPEDVRAAFLQRKAARRAAGRAALRTAVSDDEKAARSAALSAARIARQEEKRRATLRPKPGRPGLVLTADEVDAIERRRQEASSSLRIAHTRMAAAPPPCTELERWRPIDQRPFWARPEFRALLWPPPPPPPTTTDVVSDDGMSDDCAAPDDVLEVAEVPLPRLGEEFSRVEGAEALADLGQSDRPVAGAAVVVVARSHPAGRAVVAEAEAAPPPRPRKSQRTRIPRQWHLCDEPAQVARTAEDGTAAAAAVMMDVDAEVEAAPPPLEAAPPPRPRKSQRGHCPVRRHLCDEPAQVALEPARVTTRTAVAVNAPQDDRALLRRRAISRAVKLHKFPHLAAPHLRNKAHVLVHLNGIAALEALEVSVELPGRVVAGGWVLGVAYVIRSLCFLGRCSEAYDHLHGTMLARAGRGRRVAKFAWYDLTSALAAAVRHAGSRAWPGDSAVTVAERKWNFSRHLLEPDFWLGFLVDEGAARFTDLCGAMPDGRGSGAHEAYGPLHKVTTSREPRLGGEEHICGFLAIVAAAREEHGSVRLLARTVKARAAALSITQPRDIGVATWGEVSDVMCDVGTLRLAELEKLARLPRARVCEGGSVMTAMQKLSEGNHIARNLKDFSRRAMPLVSAAPEVPVTPPAW